MKACFQIAERRQSYAKIVPVSAMKACFQIAERRQSYAKIRWIFVTSKFLGSFFALFRECFAYFWRGWILYYDSCELEITGKTVKTL